MPRLATINTKPFQGLKRFAGRTSRPVEPATINTKPFQGLKPQRMAGTGRARGGDDQHQTLSGIETRRSWAIQSGSLATINTKPFQGLKLFAIPGLRTNYGRRSTPNPFRD